MQSEQLYSQILGITAPWSVTRVDLDLQANMVEVHVALSTDEACRCPECKAVCPRHDTRTRRWRHLDTCQMQTVLIAEVPRVSCGEHGTKQMAVPWAEKNGRFTAMFEALIIDWLKQASTSAVARRLGLTWDQVDGVMQRAIDRGLARREAQLPRRLGVDEKSFQKHHEYVTVVHDLDTKRVVHVADNRKEESLKGYLGSFSAAELAEVEVVTMDMHRPYINAVAATLPSGIEKIAFDKFHIAATLSKAVDAVRRQEHRVLLKQGDKTLMNSKYKWLTNPTNMTEEKWAEFEELRTSKLKTARAWAIKETMMEVWDAEGDEDFLRGAWKTVLRWAARSKLEPMKKAAKTIKTHLYGILRAQVLGVSNATAEGINSVIQKLKYDARGFRSRERFRRAILFHRGGLDMDPVSA